jgi:hypothetical protein
VARLERVVALEDLLGEAAELDAVAERGRYLTLPEREIIALERLAGLGVRVIARVLHRNTYVRTGASGAVQPSSRRYGPWRADRLARARRRRPRLRKLATDAVLWTHVQKCLRKNWSRARSRRHRPGCSPISPSGTWCTRRSTRPCTCRAAVSCAASSPPRCGPGGPLAVSRQPRFIEPMVMISRQPGSGRAGALRRRRDRRCRGRSGDRHPGRAAHPLRAAAHLPGGRDAVAVRDALVTTVQTLPGHVWRSLTWDQGSERARYREFSTATGVPVYFCDPGSPWLRGSYENTNGLLRQYFPKGTDLSVHDADRLAAVAAELNGRPAKPWAGTAPPNASLPFSASADTRQCCDDR